mmetsp:Transcript_42594/g.51134  ORF Transcript_42594/g.51134 Transcript_42594/m.51134 type:complete len:203 (+) Transcript_42594:106-714(+)
MISGSRKSKCRKIIYLRLINLIISLRRYLDVYGSNPGLINRKRQSTNQYILSTNLSCDYYTKKPGIGLFQNNILLHCKIDNSYLIHFQIYTSRRKIAPYLTTFLPCLTPSRFRVVILRCINLDSVHLKLYHWGKNKIDKRPMLTHINRRELNCRNMDFPVPNNIRMVRINRHNLFFRCLIELQRHQSKILLMSPVRRWSRAS